MRTVKTIIGQPPPSTERGAVRRLRLLRRFYFSAEADAMYKNKSPQAELVGRIMDIRSFEREFNRSASTTKH